MSHQLSCRNYLHETNRKNLLQIKGQNRRIQNWADARKSNVRQPIFCAVLIQPIFPFPSPAHLPPHPKQAVLGQLVHAEIGCFHFFRQLFREPQLHEAGFRVDDGGGELLRSQDVANFSNSCTGISAISTFFSRA